MMKKMLSIFLCAALLLAMAGCGTEKTADSAQTVTTEAPAEESTVPETEVPAAKAEPEETEPAKAAFAYEHNPEENPSAMADIIVNPDAVYGFSPDPASSRLGAYADYDWTDPEVVEKGRQDRLAYHESLYSMYEILHEMRDNGSSIEEMARAVSAERNRIRLASYNDDPEGLEKVKKSNLETYGDESGPTAESLFEKYGSWETVLQKAFGTNAGMDACLGLYDTYYTLYIELGMIQE